MGSSILAGAATHGRDSFAFIYERFNPALAVAKCAISHANNRKKRFFSRRVVPDPIRTYVEALCNVISSQQRLDCNVVPSGCSPGWPPGHGVRIHRWFGELISAGAIDNEEFGSVSGMSPPIRWSDSALVSSAECLILRVRGQPQSVQYFAFITR